MNDDSIAKHMYCHVLSVLLTGQKKKKKKKPEVDLIKIWFSPQGDYKEIPHWEMEEKMILKRQLFPLPHPL